MERRRHERVELVRVPGEKGLVRVWVFKPEDQLDALACVILDSSASGLRILVNSSEPLEATRYRLSLLTDAPAGERAALTCIVKTAWCDPKDKMGCVAGVEFEDESHAVSRFIDANPPTADSTSWIRCTLARA